ncbi:TetR/AcrR family transcriptional regulator C-terminal domain-containing protein [Dactylosporangium sp. CA-092794]|uniref:TetR/AcrR family transcriptional regulator C-terminal domain-containing protein n=1 Tax=Dactylosporangium sp. CA-092794 TaxID=3239929 RepID=UPI003D94D7A3
MTKGVTRDRIVTAALELLDEQGMDAVTVRALAARLNVRAPALYWHVQNKQELLDEMSTAIQRRVNAALSEVALGTYWRDDLAAYAGVLRAEYLLHRDGARTFSGTRTTDPEVVRAKEPWLACLTAVGFELVDATSAIDLITAFVVGFVIEEQEQRQSAEADPARYSLAQRDAWLGDGVPLVKAAGRVRDNAEHRFERQLGVLLDGLAAQLKPSDP